MRIFVPKELCPGERRVPLVPKSAGTLVKAGMSVVVESGMGAASFHDDAAYTGAELAAIQADVSEPNPAELN